MGTLAYGPLRLCVKVLANSSFKKPVDRFMWQGNISVNDAYKFIKKGFWLQVLLAWCEYNYSKPNSKEGILSAPLWLNSQLVDRGEVLYNNKAIGVNFVTVSMIISEHGIFKSYENVCHESQGTVSIIEYYKICNCIPANWKRILRTDPIRGEVIANKLVVALREPRLSSFVYNLYMRDPYIFNEKRLKWERDLGIIISLKEMSSVFKRIYGITNHSKLRTFQYRIVHRSLSTNIKLLKYKIRIDNLCSYCNLVPETESHLFYDCEVVQIFLTDLRQFVSMTVPFSKIVEPLNAAKIIFNEINPNPTEVVNFIYLVSKYYIYKHRFSNKKLYIGEFEIANYRALEKYNAAKKGLLDKHNKKWYNVVVSCRSVEAEPIQDDYIVNYIANM